MRQVLPLDRDLALGLPPPVSAVTAPPPVVMPKRAPVAVEAPPPVVTRVSVPPWTPEQPLLRGVIPDAPEPEPPPDDDALWSPCPTFTYLAGAAGSGKTFRTKRWAEDDAGITLCATTGIAAINLGGETINSVLGYFDTASLQEAYITGMLTARLGKLWKAGVRRLILDEVSMLAADQLGFLVRAVEEVNGRGYVLDARKDEDDGPPPDMGLTLVGDFCQLAPVKAGYAFEAPEWDRFAPNIKTLQHVRRQTDREFVDILRAARKGHGTRVSEYFASRGLIQQETDDHFDGPTILAKNESVDRYNALRLAKVDGAEITFASARWGKQRSEWGNPEKPPHTWGIPETLQLKEGALVMLLANRRTRDLIGTGSSLINVNGDLGTLIGAGDDWAWDPKTEQYSKPVRAAYVRLQRTGCTVTVVPVTREVKIPCDSARRAELRKEGKEDLIDGKWEIAGAITYMPLRVAYATTVHKSQGLSLDQVQVNVRDGFFKSPGMLYVALSRARTAAGLRLVGSPAAIAERCASDPRLKEWL